ncbi:4-carboxymuconolactone decarboxylase [Nocardioides terrae]|uniref:4-carboxymuconolactone decarboxylase n=1 Tax=Nocardioides terrae TaxID=574651 RepID=A0A1I1F6A8_9ACTN|nr:carboxymuconolactone decarboxylase family protein [Nocardioides terrae]SFB93238.1 4-carboxymuconolactone decarboxylase [Nocardioides terrae]
MDDEQYAAGLRMLAEVGASAPEAMIDSLREVSPELGRQTIAWGFGEIYARPGLSPRDRQLVTLGVLTALGGCEPQLEAHVDLALNVGLTREQVVEALLHAAVYAGFPRALNATLAAKRAFDARE